MRDHEQIAESLDSLGTRLREHQSVRDGVLRRITEAKVGPEMQRTAWYRSRPMMAVAGVAASVALLVAVWSAIDGGAEEAFAAAIDSVKRARTFSCRDIMESTRNGQKRVIEKICMFKEPDLEREEYVAGTRLSFPRQTTITDYGRRRRLTLKPSVMRASLEDMSSSYRVDEGTGTLEPSRLFTGMRDSLLALSAKAVEDLGYVDLDGQSVRMLRSRRAKTIVTVWIDPKTSLPVQIEIYRPQNNQRDLYTSIRIDEPLDDELFSTEPPAGYTLWRGGLYKPFSSDDLARLMMKAFNLAKKCCVYASKHDGQWPSELTDLSDVGVTEEALRALLAAPGQPDGPPIFRYRQPRPDVGWSDQVMVHQIFDEWPERGIVVGFADGHAERIKDQKRFEALTP